MSFPWSLVFLIAFIAALLVLFPVTTLGALVDAGGNWQAQMIAGRYLWRGTISQIAVAQLPFLGLLAITEVGLIRMLPAEIRKWRSRRAARGRGGA